MDTSALRRRVTAPLALLAALALAVGGGSSPWSIHPPAQRAPAHPVAMPLDHVELVAMRAQLPRPSAGDDAGQEP